MKKVLLFLFILSFAYLPVSGQNYYTIEVGTFLDAQRAHFEAIQPYGFVYAKQLNGNLYQVLIGGFEKRSEAEAVRRQVAAKGYVSAFIQPRLASEGRLVPVVQFATRNLKQEIDWGKFLQTGAVYGIIGKDQVKFATGPYTSMEEAKQNLSNIQALGFRDAFVKQVNTAILHPIGDFETGGVRAEVLPAPLSEPEPVLIPRSYNTNIYNNVPSSYEANPELYPRTPTPAGDVFNLPNPPETLVSTPNKHPRVKRSSVIELQKVLKEKGYYNSSLDGLYGSGTARGYEQFKLNNRSFQKYLLLSEYLDKPDQSAEERDLQDAVNTLLSETASRQLIERSNHPVAKAYYAYMLFQTLGPGQEVDALMNNAIQLSYAGKQFTQIPPFDYTANYSYSNLTQLILHMHYIHSAPANNFSIPCWIFQQHPTETARAYATYATFSSGGFPLQFCDQFMSWDEVKALHAIASDINVNETLDNQKIAAGASRRAEFYLAPQPVSQNEQIVLEKWNDNLWLGLNNWALRDPINQRTVTALKVLYYQSYSRFEDYFIDKGFKAKEAKGMALMTLFTVVGYHLERFA